MGFWGKIREAFVTVRGEELEATGEPFADMTEGGAKKEQLHPSAVCWSQDRDSARAVGQSVKAYRAGYIGPDETRVALASMDGLMPDLRLIRSTNGMDLALKDGRLIDYKTLDLRQWDIFGFRVVGMSYYENESNPFLFRLGQVIALQREPDNEHDPNAVALRIGRSGKKIGYVNKQRARWVAACLDSGKELSAIVIQTKASSPRVLIAPPQTLAALVEH